MSADRVPVGIRLRAQAGSALMGVRRELEHAVGGGGERHSAGTADEQSHAEVLLQEAD